MKNLRCNKCHQLQFKWELKGDKVVIEVKCYNCNEFTYFTINLASLLAGNIIKNNENNKK